MSVAYLCNDECYATDAMLRSIEMPSVVKCKSFFDNTKEVTKCM